MICPRQSGGGPCPGFDTTTAATVPQPAVRPGGPLVTGRRRWATGILTWGLIWGAVAAQPLALDFSPFAQPLAELADAGRRDDDARWLEADIPTLQAAMARGDLSAEALLVDYLDRIRRFDVDGLQAVLALNPEALALARRLDDERAAGASRGPLHGIPVLLKDNIATGDAMATTAGAHALRGWRAHRDAFLVQRLRRAGAVILGKANLSEWANYLDRRLPNGYSALGGQTRHPYGPFDPLGSSTGSAVAVSANLTAVAVGSETQGSIIQPARTNGVVGLKTSLGLVSRDYLIPLVDWMDVPGPLGRTVTDVALLLTALAGVDPADPATRDAAPLAGTDFTDALSLTAARQRRVGVELVDEADIAARLATYLGRYGEATDDTALTLEAWLRQRAAAQNAHHRAAMAPQEWLGIDVVGGGPRQVPAPPA
ncbi:MAG: amidase family protein, partial [Candidatus Competibacterales bacterium]